MKLSDIFERADSNIKQQKARLAQLKADLKEFPTHPSSQEDADAVDAIHDKIAALEKHIKQYNIGKQKDLVESIRTDTLIKNTMKRFSVPDKYFATIKSACEADYEDGGINRMTSRDVVEIMDASGIPQLGSDSDED